MFFPLSGIVPKPPNFEQGSDKPEQPSYNNGIKIKAELPPTA
jgi:biotin synthase